MKENVNASVDASARKPISKYAAKKAARIAAAANPENKDVVSTEDILPADVQEDDSTKVGKNGRSLGIKVPEHIVEIAYIVIYNSAIRRFTSLNILNYLTQTGKIRPDAGGKYVKFLWNKFQVTADGLKSEYSYREKFFLNALVAAFPQFAKNAQDTIQEFMVKEDLAYVLDGKD